MQHNNNQKGMGMIGVLVVAVLAVGLIAGGVYAFLNGTGFLKKTNEYANLAAELSAETPDELDKEIQNLDLGDLDREFADLEVEIGSL